MISFGGKCVCDVRLGDRRIREVRLGSKLIWTNEVRFVVVGDGGLIMTSSDGSAWAVQFVGTKKFNGVCYGNGKFVAVGDDGCVATSLDGKVWSLSEASDHQWSCICYGDGKFVAVGNKRDGDRQGRYMHSTDGLDWFIGSLSTTAKLSEDHFDDICFGNGKFIAVGYRVTGATSETTGTCKGRVFKASVSLSGGLNTTDYGISEYNRIGGVVFDSIKSRFLITGPADDDKIVICASSDGTAFTEICSSTQNDIPSERMFEGNNGTRVLFGSNIWNDGVFKSLDGETWLCKDDVDFFESSGCYGNGKVIVANYYGIYLADLKSDGSADFRYVRSRPTVEGVELQLNDVCCKEV